MAPSFTEALDHVYALAQAKIHPDLLERFEHAYKLASTDQVQPQGPDRWTVQGTATAPYVVTHGATWHCTCEDALYHPGQACKHTFASMLWLRAQQALAEAQMVAEEEEVREAMAPATPPQGGLSPAPLPEAPVSANVHVQIAGRDVLVTLRGTDEAEVLARLETLLQRYPVAAVAPVASQGEGKMCQRHDVVMKLNHGKEGKTWHSHKLADGQWCKGK